MGKLIKTNICIIGAGPAGSIASLFLAKAGIPCLLIDKAIFPRDKICGDVLSGEVMDLLNELDFDILNNFQQEKIQISSLGVKIIAPNLKELVISVENPDFTNKIPLALVSKRIDFDNFIIDRIRNKRTIQLIEGIEIDSFEKNQNTWLLKTKNNEVEIQANLLIIANGAQSNFARLFGKIEKDLKHHYAGVRAYYQSVESSGNDNFIELYFFKDLLPGYFWIMPLPNNLFNVGVGIRSDIIAAKKISLRNKIEEIIQKYPVLQNKFKSAKILTEPKGYGLPLGSKRRNISGDQFILVGDAASLIDPFTGEGIGNAMKSGKLAAIQAEKCVRENNYSKDFLMNYDLAVYKQLDSNFKLSKQLQRLAEYPYFLNALINTAIKSKYFAETISYLYVDENMKKRFKNPFFYLKVLFSK